MKCFECKNADKCVDFVGPTKCSQKDNARYLLNFKKKPNECHDCPEGANCQEDKGVVSCQKGYFGNGIVGAMTCNKCGPNAAACTKDKDTECQTNSFLDSSD